MLKVDFDIQQKRDASAVILTDKTTGWTDSLGIDDITATVIVHRSPIGAVTRLFTKFLPSMGSFEIPADFLNPRHAENILVEQSSGLVDCCGAPPISPLISLLPYDMDFPKFTACQEVEMKWADGCHYFRYELYVKDAIVDYSLKVKMAESEQLWLRVNDSWVNYTDDTSYNDGYRYFYTTGSVDKIDKYQVRTSLKVVAEGQVFPYNVRPGGNTGTNNSVMAGYAGFDVPLYANLEQKMTNLVGPAIMSDRLNGHCHHPIDTLMTQYAKLDYMKNDPGCSCQCIGSTIKSIDAVLSELSIQKFGTNAC